MPSGQSPSNLVSAHEIACFAYCPEQWRLQYGLKIPPANQEQMQAGTRHHERKATVKRVAEPAIGLGRWIVAAGLIGILALLWLLLR
ncbi:hypothetical protein AB1L88_25725 [Tautonia sp. JC769]|uniref:hypothetical protein n=1 Tax=Tautonia sp. JC769 TaxID=3232135 RepID=UPI00345B1984